MPPQPLFSFQQGAIARGRRLILPSISWSVAKGEHWLITGANGAGKSTLAEAIAGRHRVLRGQRSWPGLVGLPSHSIKLTSFTDTGHLFHNANAVHYYQQRFNAFDADGHLTVREYLLANGHNDASAIAALESLAAAELIDRERIKLSSGQTRKLLLAKCLAGKPEILIIDNPYLGLDARSRERLNHILDQLVAKTGITLILVSPNVMLPKCLTHRLHLEEGKISYSGAIDNPLSSPTIKAIAPELAKKLRSLFREASGVSPPPEVVRLEDVTVAYQGKAVLDQLNWRVLPGEKWVVSGNNGSGKSTLISLLYADHPQAYANRVYLFGKRRGRGESIWSVKKRIGFTSPELHAFFDAGLTARQVVLSGLTDTFAPAKDPTEEQLIFLETLFHFAALTQPQHLPFRQFSTGEQRLLLLLRALIKAPPVLLLDEPFQGLDALTIHRCRQLLELVLTEHRTLIFISHFKEEVPTMVNFELKLGTQ